MRWSEANKILVEEQPWNASRVVLFDSPQVALGYAELRRDFRERPPLALPLSAQNATDGGHLGSASLSRVSGTILPDVLSYIA